MDLTGEFMIQQKTVIHQIKQKIRNNFYITAKAFGRFAYDLNDFDASQLVEVIPQFHDTRNRYRQLEEAIREDRVGRVKEVQAEIDFIQSRKADCFLLYDCQMKAYYLSCNAYDTKLK